MNQSFLNEYEQLRQKEHKKQLSESFGDASFNSILTLPFNIPNSPIGDKKDQSSISSEKSLVKNQLIVHPNVYYDKQEDMTRNDSDCPQISLLTPEKSVQYKQQTPDYHYPRQFGSYEQIEQQNNSIAQNYFQNTDSSFVESDGWTQITRPSQESLNASLSNSINKSNTSLGARMKLTEQVDYTSTPGKQNLNFQDLPQDNDYLKYQWNQGMINQKYTNNNNMINTTDNSQPRLTPYQIQQKQNYIRQKRQYQQYNIFLDNVDYKSLQQIEFDNRTTLMIKNIPNKYTQELLLESINIKNQNKYDFFYLPIDFTNKCNVGYAFINFMNKSFIQQFYIEYHNQSWQSFNSQKICQIYYARVQGAVNINNHFQKSTIMKELDKKVKPVFFNRDLSNRDLTNIHLLLQQQKFNESNNNLTNQGSGSKYQI